MSGLDEAPESTVARPDEEARTLGLLGATGIGVGAIVGGGLVVLAGSAFRAAGPAALLGLALNGVIAFVTALSFAELGTAFPQSGGAYVFAKKILSVRAAFAVGWVLWFAYIVAAVLYALGFAEFGSQLLADALRALGSRPPEWLTGRRARLMLALVASGGYVLSLARKPTGGSQLATIGKLVVFGFLVASGLWALGVRQADPILTDFTPFMPNGFSGVVAAMGITFFSLEGFELIAGVGGAVREPRKNIPRATFLSLVVGLSIYLPLLFLIVTVGTPPGTSIMALTERHADTVTAVAVREFLGPFGYVLVMVAVVLSTLSALQACLLAASRTAYTMATDHTLPRLLATRHEVYRTPVLALFATLLAVAAILFIVPDLAAAGAATGLIFLVSFALAHWTAYLARQRGGPQTDAFRAPWFPVFPVVGGVACVALAAFQAVTVPAAGAISAVWLGLGVLLYVAAFASRAEVVDARAEARDPALLKLRGRSPMVLVPVANPDSAAGLVEVASALAPPEVGRVLLLSVMRRPDEVGDAPPESLVRSQRVLTEAIARALGRGHSPEALMTIADSPWREIERVARTRQCECILLGLTRLDQTRTLEELEHLLNGVDCDVAVLNAPSGFDLAAVRRVLVPAGGRGGQHELRARLLGSLRRSARRDIEFLRLLPEGASDDAVKDAERALLRLANDEAGGKPHVSVRSASDAVEAVVNAAQGADLLVLGLPRIDGRALFGDFAIEVARRAPCATIMLSQGK